MAHTHTRVAFELGAPVGESPQRHVLTGPGRYLITFDAARPVAQKISGSWSRSHAMWGLRIEDPSGVVREGGGLKFNNDETVVPLVRAGGGWCPPFFADKDSA